MSKRLPLSVVHEVRDACLCLATQRAARVLARRFDRAFQGLDLTNGQFSLLMALNAPTAPTMSELADFLAMDRTTLTAALKSLQARALVGIEPDDKDRRIRRLRLTDKGAQLIASAVAIWRAEHGALEREVGNASSVPATRRALTAIAGSGTGVSAGGARGTTKPMSARKAKRCAE